MILAKTGKRKTKILSDGSYTSVSTNYPTETTVVAIGCGYEIRLSKQEASLLVAALQDSITRLEGHR